MQYMVCAYTYNCMLINKPQDDPSVAKKLIIIINTLLKKANEYLKKQVKILSAKKKQPIFTKKQLTINKQLHN